MTRVTIRLPRTVAILGVRDCGPHEMPSRDGRVNRMTEFPFEMARKNVGLSPAQVLPRFKTRPLGKGSHRSSIVGTLGLFTMGRTTDIPVRRNSNDHPTRAEAVPRGRKTGVNRSLGNVDVCGWRVVPCWLGASVHEGQCLGDHAVLSSANSSSPPTEGLECGR